MFILHCIEERITRTQFDMRFLMFKELLKFILFECVWWLYPLVRIELFRGIARSPLHRHGIAFVGLDCSSQPTQETHILAPAVWFPSARRRTLPLAAY